MMVWSLTYKQTSWNVKSSGHEFGWTPGVGDGQGGLACWDSWGRKESETTEHWSEVNHSLCHFIQVQIFVTIWTLACQAPVYMGFSRQEYWSGLPCPPPGNLPDPSIELRSPMSSALAGGLFTTSSSWEAKGTLPPRIQCAQFVLTISLLSSHCLSYGVLGDPG